MTKPSVSQIVLLGTGTPNAEPGRSGSALAVVVNETPYLVDVGPGIVRRANTACQRGLQALALPNLTTVFVTHLHSDHTAGYPDLILTPWVLGRNKPLQVFGPAGIKTMTHHVLSAYQADIQERLSGLEPANANGYQVDAHEIEPGRVYEDANVCVEAFFANHGSWSVLGYRFTTSDGVIVVSGDTAPYEGIIENYQGCDILIHEVYSWSGLQKRSTAWQQYHASVHTSTKELAEIAAAVHPKLLVLCHQLLWGQTEEYLVQEIKQDYSGNVVSGHDLDIFDLGTGKKRID